MGQNATDRVAIYTWLMNIYVERNVIRYGSGGCHIGLHFDGKIDETLLNSVNNRLEIQANTAIGLQIL